MRLDTATVLYAILLPLASAKCYSDSPDNTNVQYGKDLVPDVAKLLQGNLEGKVLRGQCMTDTQLGYQWYFSIRNTGKAPQMVTKDQLSEYFNMELNGCGKRGGWRDHGWIQYNVDPNPGHCFDNKYINEHEPAATPIIQRRGGAVISRQPQPTSFEMSDLSAIRPEVWAEEEEATTQDRL